MAKRTRKAQKAPTRRAKSSSRNKKPATWPVVVAVLLFVALLGSVAYELFRPAAAPAVAGDTVLVTVNGVPLTQSKLDFHYQLLPQSYRDTMTQDDVLENLISEELIAQDAASQGITATPEDVQARVQEILAQSDITASDLEKNLASFNVSLEQFESLVARQIVLERWREANLEKITPSEEDISAAYDANKDSYAVPEEVTARHVLIRAERENAATLAKEIYDNVRAGGDLCGWVVNTTDDQGSKATCGEYTFPRGYMVPEFEEAAFGMQDGEVRLIQTQFGYHVLTRVKLTPAGTQSLADVHDEIAATLASAASADELAKKVTALRAAATIVYASDAVAAPEAPADAVIAPSEPEAEAAPEPAVPQEEAQQAPEAVVPEPAVAPSASESAAAVLSCVAGKTVLFGTSWSSDTLAGRKLFSDNGVALRYVACDAQGASCPRVSAYPTWDIAGTQYLGRMTIEQLRRAADC